MFHVLNMNMTLLETFLNSKQLQNCKIELCKYNIEYLIGVSVIFVNSIYMGLHTQHFRKTGKVICSQRVNCFLHNILYYSLAAKV